MKRLHHFCSLLLAAGFCFSAATLTASSPASSNLALASGNSSPVSDNSGEARLLRFPTIGGGKIVFTYAGDLYSVDENGGVASRLTSHEGFEMFAKISPDGKSIMFTGQYDGNTELYSMPLEGGEPVRITYSATVDRDNVGERMGPNNIVMGWTPDGKKVIYRSKWHNFSGLRGRLYTVDAQGGMPQMLPTTEGGFCSFSPDGKYLAMNRMFREFRTWKYYKGGQADEIWIHKIGTTSIEKITDNDSQDIFPMWIGDKIFYMSDRDRTMNLFCYDTKSKSSSKVTDFDYYDCKFPSANQGKIVFENGGYIYKYTVATGKLEKVNIFLNADNVWSRSEFTTSLGAPFCSLSPNGKTVVTIVRGDIYSIPAEEGAVMNVSHSPYSHEREVLFSPDGKSIAWFSDKDGEYNVYVASASDMHSARKLTSFTSGYPQGLMWSPDSRNLYFANTREIYSLDVQSSNAKVILSADPAKNPKTSGNAIRGFVLNKDGKWAAYSQEGKNKVAIIYLYDIVKGESYPVTDSWYDSRNPLFSDDGKTLFFTSARSFRSIYSQVEWNTAFTVSDYVFQAPLSKDTTSTVDVKGIAGRVSSIKELKPANYRLIRATKEKLYFSTYGGFGSQGGRPGLKSYDFKSKKESEVGKYTVISFSANGKKAVVRESGFLYVVNFPASGKLENPLKSDEMDMIIDHKAEWKQIFDESWRITRDGFYVENMHGNDWNKVYEKYAQLLPYVNHRHDLTYIIGEMIGELNVGHAYITSGDAPEPKRVKTGLLGAQLSRDKSGAYRIEKIYKGENWSENMRSPFTEPGSEAQVGEYIIEVNGVPAKEYENIYCALVGKAGKKVELTIASSAEGKGSRKVVVKCIEDESHLAYYEWVRRNITIVDKLSNGQIGYIHIPDMGADGLEQFTKLFYAQLDKKALIIDDRMNGGGNVSPMIIERLQREVYRMSMYRNGANEPVPNQAFYGPKVCIIDKYSSSDGDLFPWGFKQLKLGKVIGKRSWGGIVGISGSKNFVDGQDMRTPFFTSYGLDGKWIIEGHGVDPDIDIDINPFEDFKGNDAQLNKAVEVLLEELKGWPDLPGTPAAPDKTR